MENGYHIIKEANELRKADAPSAGEGTTEGGGHEQGIAPILQCQEWSEGALLRVIIAAERQALPVGTGAWLTAGQRPALHIQARAL